MLKYLAYYFLLLPVSYYYNKKISEFKSGILYAHGWVQLINSTYFTSPWWLFYQVQLNCPLGLFDWVWLNRPWELFSWVWLNSLRLSIFLGAWSVVGNFLSGNKLVTTCGRSTEKTWVCCPAMSVTVSKLMLPQNWRLVIMSYDLITS